MSLDKHQLRTFYKELRAALSEEELNEMSLQITEHVIAFLRDREELIHFHLFFPIAKQREINTYPIYDFLKQRSKAIYTSKVEADSFMLSTLRLKPTTKFQIDDWGIPVPTDFEITTNELLQVVFVPLLAYDQLGNRIGFGKGYYDVFLKSLQPNVLRIGLSFFSPELIIPSESHDELLDFCITPNKTYFFK